MKYILDSSILIKAFSKNDRDILLLLNKLKDKSEILIPSIVFTELRVGMTDAQASSLLPVLQEAGEVVSVNLHHSLKAGQLLRKYKDNGISLVDSLIAAISIVESASLISLDNDFSVIKELSIFKI